jgi:SAM-dependent methyltransferase
VGDAEARWRQELAAWEIPTEILASAEESPWALPRPVFVRRAQAATDAPEGPSYDRAWEALEPPGSVLDVGSGAGAASLPLASRTTHVTGVDTDEPLLGQFAATAAKRGIACDAVVGRWPDIAEQVPPADVVVCHHVFYNVPDLGAFAMQLTAHARRRVVVEVTAAHPLIGLNPLWRHFHGLDRPDGPTAEDALGVLTEVGIDARVERWHRAEPTPYDTFEELVAVTRRRLCLPVSRTDEVAAALRGLSGGGNVAGIGSAGRDLVTLWWSILA